MQAQRPRSPRRAPHRPQRPPGAAGLATGATPATAAATKAAAGHAAAARTPGTGLLGRTALLTRVHTHGGMTPAGGAATAVSALARTTGPNTDRRLFG